MPALDTFTTCRMTQFAALIANDMDVSVVLRGDDVCVDMSRQPPVIYMPAMEYSKEDNLRPFKGFVLHEAAHIRYTNQAIVQDIPNYLSFRFFNLVEDEFIERRLERDFPGARGMLVDSYLSGLTHKKADGKPRELSWNGLTFLGEEGRARTMARLMASFPNWRTLTSKQVADVATRLEADRVGRMWFVSRRRYDLPLFDYLDHPWRPIFEEVTATKTKSSKDSLKQALRLIERLGVKPCLPDDDRPVTRAREAIREASRMQREAEKARKQLLRLRKSIARRTRELIALLPEHQALIDANENAAVAMDDLRDARESLKEVSDRRKALRAERGGIAAGVTRQRARIKALKEQRAGQKAKTPSVETPVDTPSGE